jgi:hypothetical protein
MYIKKNIMNDNNKNLENLKNLKPSYNDTSYQDFDDYYKSNKKVLKKIPNTELRSKY